MSVVVRPMTDAEYERWAPAAEEGYATDMIESGGVDPGVARRKAEHDFAALLPGGLRSEGQLLFTIEDDGEVAGDLWLCEREVAEGQTLFVYDVRVHEGRRRRGLGRAAMLFAEEECRRRGLPAVSLNVFGGNEVARGLYRSLGYRETAVWMAKDV